MQFGTNKAVIRESYATERENKLDVFHRERKIKKAPVAYQGYNLWGETKQVCYWADKDGSCFGGVVFTWVQDLNRVWKASCVGLLSLLINQNLGKQLMKLP